MGLSLEDESSSSNDPGYYVEGRNLQDLKFLGHQDAVGPKSLTGKFSCKKYFTVDSPLSDDRFKGSSGGDPAEQAYYHLFAFDTSNGDLGIIRFSVLIEYIAMLTEPSNPGSS
mgnify:CR=1 FL=1